jgi:hypothetical protein
MYEMMVMRTDIEKLLEDGAQIQLPSVKSEGSIGLFQMFVDDLKSRI